MVMCIIAAIFAAVNVIISSIGLGTSRHYPHYRYSRPMRYSQSYSYMEPINVYGFQVIGYSLNRVLHINRQGSFKVGHRWHVLYII